MTCLKKPRAVETAKRVQGGTEACLTPLYGIARRVKGGADLLEKQRDNERELYRLGCHG